MSAHDQDLIPPLRESIDEHIATLLEQAHTFVKVKRFELADNRLSRALELIRARKRKE